jgi:hypothetical protein
MANGRKPIPQAGGGSGNNGHQSSRRYAGGRGYRRRPASSQTDEVSRARCQAMFRMDLMDIVSLTFFPLCCILIHDHFLSTLT